MRGSRSRASAPASHPVSHAPAPAHAPPCRPGRGPRSVPGPGPDGPDGHHSCWSGSGFRSGPPKPTYQEPPRPTQAQPGPCNFEVRQFLDCATGQYDLSLCEGFSEALKQCKFSHGVTSLV
ncbi:hypothetical protein KUCAC02_015045 [Chaenocephalus aceratus]|uniref:Uncharacterized protein n=1 Tax=Chaenocephalus aceratus TaxID=36190 RepID=A0ACB9XYE3_CHAAC|nr:hypothetical protein KUCAC02_015045 [Chaenocephalus aceratus]